jgi:hypothetical protein
MITLEAGVFRWARAEAARKKVSGSRLFGEMLSERMPKEDGYEAALRRALVRKPFPKSNVRLMSRDEVHERSPFG